MRPAGPRSAVQVRNTPGSGKEIAKSKGVVGVNALGQMGANGAGNINMSSGDGFNMVEMMASMIIFKLS